VKLTTANTSIEPELLVDDDDAVVDREINMRYPTLNKSIP
jgi:hypothetical protein